MARCPRMPSRCPTPPQPQKRSLGSSVTTQWPASQIAFGAGIAAEPESAAERPDANHLVELAARRRNAGGHRVGVVQRPELALAGKRRARAASRRCRPFSCCRFGRLFDHAVANDSRAARPRPPRSRRPAAACSISRRSDIADSFRPAFRRESRRARRFRIPPDGAQHAVVLHHADRQARAGRSALRSACRMISPRTCSAYSGR